MKFKRPNSRGYQPNHPHRLDENGKVKRLYRIWIEMRSRCTNPKKINYKWYGGKGIRVCERWYDYLIFHKDMNKSYYEHIKNFGEKNTTLDRINNTDDYSKENCRWATIEEQHENMFKYKHINFKNKTQSLKKWSKELNMNYTTLYSRIYKDKLSIEKAFIVPIRAGNRKKDFK